MYGLPPTYDKQQKFGRIPDIDSTNANEDVWDGTGAYGGFLAAATVLKVSSGSTDDTATGPGQWPISLGTKCDVRLRVVYANTNNSSLSGGFDIALER